MALEKNQIQDSLIKTFEESIFVFHKDTDIFTFEVAPDKLNAVILFLKNDPTLRFNFLTDLCGVHFPENDITRQFSVVYHLHNWIDNIRIRIKVFIDGKEPEIKTLTTIFPAANWMERETYDFFGIKFIGHPQLKRILNMEEMTSFPMRKEFPLEDGGRTDKDDRFFGRTVGNQ